MGWASLPVGAGGSSQINSFLGAPQEIPLFLSSFLPPFAEDSVPEGLPVCSSSRRRLDCSSADSDRRNLIFFVTHSYGHHGSPNLSLAVGPLLRRRVRRGRRPGAYHRHPHLLHARKSCKDRGHAPICTLKRRTRRSPATGTLRSVRPLLRDRLSDRVLR